MNHETIRKVLLITAAVVLLSPGVRAQTVDIPYQGWLTLGDQPCNGVHSMVFSLYDVATGGTAVWSDTIDVDVSNGAFSVVLPVASAVVLGYQGLYLEIKVNDTTLVNRQRIYPAMYAARDMPGTPHFYVHSDPSDGIAITSGAWTAYSDLGGIRSRAEICNDTNSYNALMIAGNRMQDTDVRKINMYDSVSVDKDVTVGGNLSVPLGSFVINSDADQTTIKGFRTSTFEAKSPPDGGVPAAVDTFLFPANAICFLTQVYFWGDQDYWAENNCSIQLNGVGRYALIAGNSSADPNDGSWCKATCLTWDW